jgi:diguanylate cyclase (GGDEF)-like protein
MSSPESGQPETAPQGEPLPEQAGLSAPSLLEAIAAISTPLETADIAAEAGRRLLAAVDADFCSISRWDETTNTVRLWAEVHRAGLDQDEVLFAPFHLEEYPLSAEVLQRGIVAQVRVNDPDGDPYEQAYLRKVESLSLLMLPLRSRSRVLGLIELFDDRAERLFPETQIAHAQVLAGYAGVAIERALLLEEANRRAAEMEALRYASLSLTTGMELQDVFEAVLSACLRISPQALGVHIFTYDGERLSFGAAKWSEPEMATDRPYSEPRPHGLTYSVARSGRMIAVDDVHRHPMFTDAPGHWRGSIIGLPLKSGDRVVGVMNIGYKQPRTLAQQEVQLLNLLADQAAVAIHRALTLEDARRRAAELEALHQASLKLTASLDQEEVFDAVLNAALQLSADALDAHIFTCENERVTFGAALWADGRRNSPWKEPRQDGLTYRVARGGQAVLVPDISDHELFAGADFPAGSDGWPGAIIGLPLKISERVVGVMNVAYQRPRAFSGDDLRVLSLLADQAAVAIENARLHNLVSRQAVTDMLTDLPNRRAFNARLQEEIRRSDRYQHSFALGMLDMNDFKRVNDTFGHPVGDETLQQAAHCMRAAIRDTDFLARLGGDEFALILPETSLAEAAKVAEKIKAALRACRFSWNRESGPFTLSVSVGLSYYPQDTRDSERLIALADHDLYEDKQRNGAR